MENSYSQKEFVGRFWKWIACVWVVGSLVACPSPPNPDCSISLNPSSVSILKGTQGNVTVNIVRSCGITGDVSFRVDDATQYPFAVTFDPSSTSGNQTSATISVPTNAQIGVFSPVIRALVQDGNSRAATLQISIVAP